MSTTEYSTFNWITETATSPIPCDSDAQHIILTGCEYAIGTQTNLKTREPRQFHVCRQCFEIAHLPALENRIEADQ